MKANHNIQEGYWIYITIERTKTKIKFESKSQLTIDSSKNIIIERTKTKIKFESKSQLYGCVEVYGRRLKELRQR